MLCNKSAGSVSAHSFIAAWIGLAGFRLGRLDSVRRGRSCNVISAILNLKDYAEPESCRRLRLQGTEGMSVGIGIVSAVGKCQDRKFA